MQASLIQQAGQVIWITGLSGAGKSSLASEVVSRFRTHGDKAVLLDGDELREVFGAAVSSAKNYGREGRLALAFQYAHLCRVIANQKLTVVIATISLFNEIHVWNRENLPGYFEVYLKVPVKELRRRDPKGIYLRFDAGELANVAGLDLTIEEPQSADWVADFIPERTVRELAEELMLILEKKRPA